MTTIPIVPTLSTLAQQLAQEVQELLAKPAETPPASGPDSTDNAMWGG